MLIFIVVADISKSGGTERATCVLADILIELSYKVILVSLSSSDSQSSFYNINSKVQIKHMGLEPIPNPFSQKLRWYPSVINVLKKYAATLSPQLIIGTGHNLNCILPFIKLWQKTAIIGCEHWEFSNLPSSSRVLMKLIYKQLDGLVALSEAAKENLKPLNNKTFVIPNALPFWANDISKLESKRILLVGRLSEEKGYSRLVPIARSLKASYPNWHIDIFGDGPLKSSLTKLYKESNLEEYITIHLPVKNIEEKYRESSIYLMLSYNEAMPMAILEAKNCGLPVVAYSCEGTNALIKNGEDGFCIEDENQELIVEKLSLLIENHALRAKMGVNARKNSFEYSRENISNKWKLLIDNLLL